MSQNYKFNNFSIVVPVFNEEKIFLESAKNIYNICKKTGLNFEIIFSENGSKDKTLEIAENFVSDKLECTVISDEIPDYGNALKNGFREAKNEITISFDIDYYSEEFLYEALHLNDKFSAIIASKRLRDSNDDRSIIRRLISNVFSLILRIIFGTKLSDTHGMKAIKTDVLKKELENIISTQWMFDTELLMRIEKKGHLIKEVPIIVTEIRPSVYSMSGDIPKTLYLIVRLRLRMFLDIINSTE
jgi:glycosyltransferase involved in cell wall biosynthesis